MVDDMVHKKRLPKEINFWLPQQAVEKKGEIVAHVVLDEYGRAYLVNPVLKTGRLTSSLLFR